MLWSPTTTLAIWLGWCFGAVGAHIAGSLIVLLVAAGDAPDLALALCAVVPYGLALLLLPMAARVRVVLGATTVTVVNPFRRRVVIPATDVVKVTSTTAPIRAYLGRGLRWGRPTFVLADGSEVVAVGGAATGRRYARKVEAALDAWGEANGVPNHVTWRDIAPGRG